MQTIYIFFIDEQQLQPLQVRLIKHDVLETNEENSSELENSTLSAEKSDNQPKRTRLNCIYCKSTTTYLYKKSLDNHFKRFHPDLTVTTKKCARLIRNKEDLKKPCQRAFHENASGRKKKGVHLL